MKLHQNPQLFREIVLALFTQSGISPAFIEKDYWLTTILRALSRSSYAEITVFKGGTSLSKAYGMIERFSEDVDLALIVQDLSNNQIKSRMDSISKAITKHLPEVQREGITSKGSRFRRTAHEYPIHETVPAVTQMGKDIILEINTFANPYPYDRQAISSMMANFLTKQGRQDLIAEYELEPFFIQVLHPTRTLAEKVLALARASYHDDYIKQLQDKIRHTYDLYWMLQQPDIQAFVASDDFFTTLKAVQADDAKNSEFQGAWAKQALTNAKIYQDDPVLWKKLESTYTGSFKSLVYGDIPPLTDIQTSLRQLSDRLLVFDERP